MQRAVLWQRLEKGKHVPLVIASVRKMPGSPIVKSRVVPAAPSVLGDVKTVDMVDPDDSNQTIRVKTIRMTALANAPPKRFQEMDKTLMIVNGDRFEHLPRATMHPLWLFDEMARAETLIGGSQTIIMNLHNFLWKENDWRLKEDPGAPRVLHLLRVPMYSWRTKPKAAGDPTVFDVRWLLILAPEDWDKKVLFRHPTFSMHEASRIDRFLLLYRSRIISRLV